MGIVEKMRLDGKKGFVTGAARGIGKCTAMAFAEAGADIAVVDMDIEEAKRTAEEIAAATGVKAIAIRCDVGSSTLSAARKRSSAPRPNRTKNGARRRDRRARRGKTTRKNSNVNATPRFDASTREEDSFRNLSTTPSCPSARDAKNLKSSYARIRSSSSAARRAAVSRRSFRRYA